jgi:hypothetical protein
MGVFIRYQEGFIGVADARDVRPDELCAGDCLRCEWALTGRECPASARAYEALADAWMLRELEEALVDAEKESGGV